MNRPQAAGRSPNSDLPGRSRPTDSLWFAAGTLTRIPVPPPTSLDERVAARGLAGGPLVGLLIGIVSGLPLLVPALGSLTSAVISVAIAAYVTRGLHWDGLADTADGLGSAKPPAGALEVMRRSDIGPFGTLTLSLTATIQVAALAELGQPGWSRLAAWTLAQVGARWALTLGCARWARPARPDGLGRLVIGRLGPMSLMAATLLTSLTGGALLLATEAPLRWLPATALAALAISTTLTRIARDRFGGSTGDVLGATVELTVAASLVAMSI
ncbi:MAG: adenosylcobinamide-GDP ribazoletransferase [Candidatus Nanopelagicales bacterium]